MKWILSSLLIFFFILGCEYNLHDNFVNIENSLDKDIQMGIYLDVESDGDTLYMHEFTYIQFNLETFGYEVYSCIFRLGNMLDDTKGSTEWNFNKSSGSFYISSSIYTTGHYTLTCDIYVKSGTGSIADQLGAELFYGTFQWPVEFHNDTEPSLSHNINEEGYTLNLDKYIMK